MKKNLLATFVLLITLALNQETFAQRGPDRGPRKEKIESMKIAFLTERLDLSPAEAKTFWPVYNDYRDEMDQLQKTRRENLMDARRNFDEMSDADIDKLIDGQVALRQQELDILKKYNPQFKKVLPIRKVALLYRSEEEFKGKLLEKLQERKEERRMDRQPMR